MVVGLNRFRSNDGLAAIAIQRAPVPRRECHRCGARSASYLPSKRSGRLGPCRVKRARICSLSSCGLHWLEVPDPCAADPEPPYRCLMGQRVDCKPGISPLLACRRSSGRRYPSHRRVSATAVRRPGNCRMHRSATALQVVKLRVVERFKGVSPQQRENDWQRWNRCSLMPVIAIPCMPTNAKTEPGPPAVPAPS